MRTATSRGLQTTFNLAWFLRPRVPCVPVPVGLTYTEKAGECTGLSTADVIIAWPHRSPLALGPSSSGHFRVLGGELLGGQHHPVIWRPCGKGLLYVVIPLLEAGNIYIGLQGLFKENSEIEFHFDLKVPQVYRQAGPQHLQGPGQEHEWMFKYRMSKYLNVIHQDKLLNKICFSSYPDKCNFLLTWKTRLKMRSLRLLGILHQKVVALGKLVASPSPWPKSLLLSLWLCPIFWGSFMNVYIHPSPRSLALLPPANSYYLGTLGAEGHMHWLGR